MNTPASAPTILLVDDDADSRTIYATILRAHGYRVLEAHTGSEAVPLAREFLPALVVMDLKMPQMDGWKALELLRAGDTTADLPIVALTIVAGDEDRRDPLRRGFDAHWLKPMTPSDLLNNVQRWLHGSRQQV